jgi:hypothetical protein
MAHYQHLVMHRYYGAFLSLLIQGVVVSETKLLFPASSQVSRVEQDTRDHCLGSD